MSRLQVSDEVVAAQRGLVGLDQGILGLQTDLLAITQLPWDEALDSVAGLARARATDLPFRMKVTVQRSAGWFPGEHWAHLESAAHAVVEHLLAYGYGSREARAGGGKSALMSVRLIVEQGGDANVLIVRDDGIAPTDRLPLAQLPLAVRVRPTADGCDYVILVPHRPVRRARPYLTFRSGKYRLAMPVERILTIVEGAPANGRHLRWQGRLLPYVPLSRLLGAAESPEGPLTVPLCLVTRIGSETGGSGPRARREDVVALGVDLAEAVVTAFPIATPPLIAAHLPFVEGVLADQQDQMLLIVSPEILLGLVGGGGVADADAA